MEQIPENMRRLLGQGEAEPSFWWSLISAIEEPLFIVDADKRIIFYNRPAEELTGFSREQVEGQPCIVGVRCVNCLLDCELFRHGALRNKSLELVTQDGRIIQVVKNARVIRNVRGEIIAGIETFRDVTSERAFQSASEAAAHLGRAIIDSIDEGLVAIDGAGSILHINAGMEKIIGAPADDFIGKPLSALIALPAGANQGVTTIRLSSGEERQVDIRSQPLELGSGDSGSLLLFRHITPNDRVRAQLEEQAGYRGIISRSPAMMEIFNLVETIAASDVTVLVEGESGTGKEMIARALHQAGDRRDQPFQTVNCSVFNENLLESELFGHCRGAFTGAVSDRVGHFELAHRGTLFLDEIGELPPKVQVKLLRFLQTREFERVGETRTRKVDVRIIAATNRDLRRAIQDGAFRDDLYYRLCIIPITLPPLRDRAEDIPLLAAHFVQAHASMDFPAAAITAHALDILARHPWPGNVRELENVILHALTRCGGRPITADHLPHYLRGAGTTGGRTITPPATTVRDAERETILTTLREQGFNRARTASALGITRTTLWRKLKRYQLIP